MRARDHFLAGVAPLVEVNCAQYIKVQHLGDKFLRGRRIDLRFAALDGKLSPPTPLTASALTLIRAANVQRALGIGAQLHQKSLVGPRRFGLPDEAINAPLGRQIFNLDLGAQGELRKPLCDACGKLARQHRQYGIGCGTHELQHGDHAALRIVIAGKLRASAWQLLHVIGELTLQETLRIGSCDAQHAQVGERHEFGRVVSSLQHCFCRGFRWSRHWNSGRLGAHATYPR